MIWDDEAYMAFDFETSATQPEFRLQPWRVAQKKAWVTSLATVRRQSDHTLIGGGLNPTRDMMAAMLEEAIREERRLVGWFVVFDIMWLLAYDLRELVFKTKFLDGRLLWRHAVVEPEYELGAPKKRPYGLKDCVADLWPEHAGYQEDIDFDDTDPEVRRRLHEYNIRDSIFTLRGAKHWWNRLTNVQQKVALIEAECLPLIAAANLRGMLVDTLACKELRAHLKGIAQDKIDLLAPLGVTEKIVRSPTQLAELLFDHWGLPVVKETKGGKTGADPRRSTDKEVLHELALGFEGHPADPRIKTLRDYREALNNCTKFAEGPLKSVDYNEDGCTHPMAIPFSTYTGRLTYASKQRDVEEEGKRIGTTKKVERPIGFALHQEKRDKMYRNILVAPSGYTLMEFDASGQEFRWMAVASKDPTMLSLCFPSEDAHCFMGARVTERDYHEIMTLHKQVVEEVSGPQGIRNYGKLANLSLQYRTSARKLRTVARVDYNIPMEMPQAEFIWSTYQKTYPGVPIYWKFQIARTQRLGYVETMAGRRVSVQGDWTGSYGWSMGSTAINYRIQATGADQKYLAIMVLKPYLTTIGAYFGWDLHDGLYFYVPNAQVARAAVIMKYRLDNLPYKEAWGFTPPIPMPWDCSTGGSWGTLKNWEFE